MHIDTLEAKLKIALQPGELLVNLIEQGTSQADARGSHTIPLDAYGYRWYRVADVAAVPATIGPARPA